MIYDNLLPYLWVFWNFFLKKQISDSIFNWVKFSQHTRLNLNLSFGFEYFWMDEIYIFFLIFDSHIGRNRMIYLYHELKLFYDSNSNWFRLIYRPTIDSFQNWVIIWFLKNPIIFVGKIGQDVFHQILTPKRHSNPPHISKLTC